MKDKPARLYPVVSLIGSRDPDYARVARALSDIELEEEILEGLGEPGYRLALVQEHERRAGDGGPL